MKNSVKKILLSIVVGASLVMLTHPALATNISVNMPYSIYESRESKHLSSGIKHENILKFTTAGWWNINVIRIDLKDEYIELKGLINPNGIPSRDKVTTLVDKYNAVAAVNGDYFNYSPLPSAMGTLINNGEVISSPVEIAYALPSFYLTQSNIGGVDYLDRNIVVTSLTNGHQIIVNTLNKVTSDFGTVTLLNKHWGKKSLGSKFHKDLTEALIIDDVIQEIRKGGQAFDIPANGYVLAVRGEALSTLIVNTRVALQVETTPNVEDIKFAIGGGSIILKNGELALTNIISKGNEPRTGIAVNKDNTELMLVTIDGRDNSFKGVSQEMFGAILRDLGAHHAMNLDGGGSTTMAIKPIGDENSQVVNKPSDGGERSVVNAVGVLSNAPKGELNYLKVTTDDIKMFPNISRRFKVKGFDTYHNPVEIDESQVELTIEGIEGTIEGNELRATTSGPGKVIANYNGVIGTIDITVLGEIKDLNTKLKNFNIDLNSEKTLSNFYGKDKNGYESLIYIEDVEFSITNNIGTIENGVFNSGTEALGGAITAKVGEGVENILVSVGSKGTVIESFEKMDSFSFSSYPKEVPGSIEISNEAKEGNNSILLNYDFSKGENTRVAYVNLNPNNGGLKLAGIPKKLGIWVKGDGNGSWLRGSLKDSKGKEVLFDLAKTVEWTDWQYIIADLPSNLNYPITLERIYLAEINNLKKQSGKVIFDGLQAFYPSPIENMVLPSSTSLKDDSNKKNLVEKDGFTFVVATEPKGLNELVGYDAISTVKSKISEHNISFLLNGLSPEFQYGLKNEIVLDASLSYGTNKRQDVFFINLNSTKDGIRAANSEQWIKLNNDLKSRTESTIILYLPTPIFGVNGFKDTLEADLLHNTLVQTKDLGKNIFVVHGGNSNNTDLKDGIRYIQLNTKALTSTDDIYDLNLIEFVANGSDISYEINPIFKRPNVKVN